MSDITVGQSTSRDARADADADAFALAVKAGYVSEINFERNRRVRGTQKIVCHSDMYIYIYVYICMYRHLTERNRE